MRLSSEAKQEGGPEQPRLSTQTAYLLLAGLATQGAPMEGLTEAEQLSFGVEKRGGRQGKVFAVTDEVRVALVDFWIQDKSGTYVERRATLFVHQGSGWTSRGEGMAIGRE